MNNNTALQLEIVHNSPVLEAVPMNPSISLVEMLGFNNEIEIATLPKH